MARFIIFITIKIEPKAILRQNRRQCWAPFSRFVLSFNLLILRYFLSAHHPAVRFANLGFET